MLTKISSRNARFAFVVSPLIVFFFSFSATAVNAQSLARANSGKRHSLLHATSATAKQRPEDSTGDKKPETTEEKLSALEQMLERQNERLDQLQQTIA
ncbi:MAG: hypothetical protein ACREA9_22350, partial [Pyrinomonadaceae bacterium]